MASLSAELGSAIEILLVLYTIQAQRGAFSLPVTMWIDNAEVLERANNTTVGDNIKNNTVFNYDSWQAMTSLQMLISIPQ